MHIGRMSSSEKQEIVTSGKFSIFSTHISGLMIAVLFASNSSNNIFYLSYLPVFLNPIYEVTYKGKRFAMFKSMVGEPLCVGQYEEIIAMGSKRLILLGNCGVLDKRIEDCGIIIPIKAVRDEGTSYHYAKPCDTIDVNHNYRDEFKKVLKEFGYPYVEGITWTTDACYRETRDKVNKRKEMGAVCVEMECAGMQALCDFRGTEFFQFFYAGDNLDHSSWEPRSLSGSARLDDKSKIMLLAFELGLKILEKL
jgi:purine-nucleoside phosphorylase